MKKKLYLTPKRGIYANNPNGYIVRLSEQATLSICLSALEAYSVYHKGRNKIPKSRLETYGSLWGASFKLSNGKRLYNIDMACIDTSAAIDNKSASYNRQAINLKRDVVSSFWPQLDYLGDFHSHPYNSLSEVNENEGFYLSDGDKKDLKDNSDFWKKHRYRVGIVIAITAMGRAVSKPPNWLSAQKRNTIIINLGNHRLWITAYIVYKEGGFLVYSKDNDDVLLDCPSLNGLKCEHTTFGRATNGIVSRHIPGQIYKLPTKGE